MNPESRGRHRLAVISALGVFEILSWGSSFYLLAVLAGPIAAETGWPLSGSSAASPSACSSPG